MTPDSRETTELLNNAQTDSRLEVDSHLLDSVAGWLTLAVVLFILVMALFPFNFSAQATAFRREGYILDWFQLVAKDPLGWFLNVLFFVPFGLVWAWWTRGKRCGFLAGWVSAIIAGFLLSVTVEWLQLFVPTRDSSWDDVAMNTIGALVGWLLFRRYGMRWLTLVENAMEDLSAALER